MLLNQSSSDGYHSCYGIIHPQTVITHVMESFTTQMVITHVMESFTLRRLSLMLRNHSSSNGYHSCYGIIYNQTVITHVMESFTTQTLITHVMESFTLRRLKLMS